MQLSIKRFVGLKGKNVKEDVELIQILLNCFNSKFSPLKKLSQDGKCGSKTIQAIRQFQIKVIKMTSPDSRIDPNGATFRSLTQYYKLPEQSKIDAYQKKKYTWEKLIELIKPKIYSPLIYRLNNLSDYKVTYKSNIKSDDRIVSEYSKNVIRLALKESGMSHAVITSTIITPKKQAAIMYRNAKKDLRAQFNLYSREGDKVLTVFQNNSGSSQEATIELMEQKIIELLGQDIRVSKHCVTKDVYKEKNIIDIGVNSTRSLCGKEFNKDKFTKALEFLKKSGYIDTFIDETKKSNNCWHIEITPNKKAII